MNYKKTFVFFLFGIILFGCKETPKEHITEKSFFTFDEIIHYSTEMTENDFSQEIKKSKKENVSELILQKIVIDYYPKNISKSDSFEKELIESGYLKSVLEHSKYKEIDAIFSESDCEDETFFGCVQFFRDILIFKKENKTIGIAKICFECEKHYIIGTDKKTDNFGKCGGFKKLKSLLN